MRVHSHHFTFTIAKEEDETFELHRTRAFAIAALIDEHPKYIAHLDEVNLESKRFVALLEARCYPMPNNFKYFTLRPEVKTVSTISSIHNNEITVDKSM